MRNPTAVEQLAQRLNYVGSALVVAAGIAFIWAVGFTEGVRGLVDGLMIAGLGFFIPGVATFWVAWIITVAAADGPVQAKTAPPARRRRRALEIVGSYLLAVLLVLAAAAARESLTPLIGTWAPFSTFYIAVIVAAWIGGMGPAGVATAISIPLIWKTFSITPPVPAGTTGELIATMLFLTVALAIGGITSALRMTRSGVQLMRDELQQTDAALDEAEARFRALADASPVMIWLSDFENDRLWVNKAWLEFTGRSSQQELGNGWMESIHPEDLQRCRTRYREGLERREHFTAVFRLLSRDGTYRRVQDEVTPRFLPGQRFAGLQGHCVEVNVGRGRVSAATEAGIAGR